MATFEIRTQRKNIQKAPYFEAFIKLDDAEDTAMQSMDGNDNRNK